MRRDLQTGVGKESKRTSMASLISCALLVGVRMLARAGTTRTPLLVGHCPLHPIAFFGAM